MSKYSSEELGAMTTPPPELDDMETSYPKIWADMTPQERWDFVDMVKRLKNRIAERQKYLFF